MLLHQNYVARGCTLPLMRFCEGENYLQLKQIFSSLQMQEKKVFGKLLINDHVGVIRIRPIIFTTSSEEGLDVGFNAPSGVLTSWQWAK